MSEIDLATKFPELRPIDKAPTLFTANGCGMMLRGSRDFDEETGTYVKTHCFVLIFVPLFSVGAYRVADAGNGGWYFIGKEPLSAFARMMNVMLVAGVLAAVGVGFWVHRLNSPEYIAARKLAEAEELAAEGEWRAAAEQYAEVARTQTPSAGPAIAGLEKLLPSVADKASAEDAVAVVEVGESLKYAGVPLNGLCRSAVKMAERFAASDPGRAFAILQAVDRLQVDPVSGDEPDAARLKAVRKKALTALVAKEPDNVVAAGELAAILESERKFEECKKLLEPHLARLGDTEGARVLGQIYAREGNIEQAHKLLVPYCKDRLKKLHAAENDYSQRIVALQQRLRKELNGKNAREIHGAFIERFEKTPENQRSALYQQYFIAQMRKDAALNKARARLRHEARIVPVALDLGRVQLQRGRKLADPKQRDAELKKAEETFLAVRGVAGGDAEYQLSLGQVYYWLGRQKEGRKLFDDFLAGRKRQAESLNLVASLLRTLGAESEARKMAEEAYRTADKSETKSSAASLRAKLSKDLDDKIRWLGRADADDTAIQAELNSAKGRRAAREGRDQDALLYYRKAIELYDKMPESVGSLNNGGLVWLARFDITQDQADFDAAAKKIDKAVSLMPTDAILVSNAGLMLWSASLRGLVGNRIDVKTLQVSPGTGLLSYLYNNARERKVWIERVRDNAAMKKAMRYFDNASTLAPRNSTNYSLLLARHAFVRDLPATRELVGRLRSANVDTSQSVAKTVEYIQGKGLAKSLKELRVGVDRMKKAVEKTKAKRDVNFAVARAMLASQLIAVWGSGGKAEPDEVVRLAEEAYQAAKSASTRSTLITALSFRALQTASNQSKIVAAECDRFRRVLSSRYLLAALLAHHDRARTILQKDADVRRILLLMEESNKHFPGSASGVEWAFLRGLDPQRAATMVEVIAKDERSRLLAQAGRLLAPADAGVALEMYWRDTLQGRTAEANKLLAEFRKLGVPLPVGK